jgi:hypothetical protein
LKIENPENTHRPPLAPSPPHWDLQLCQPGHSFPEGETTRGVFALKKKMVKNEQQKPNA